MPTYLIAAQILKIAAGVAQLGFAVWLVRRLPRTRVNLAFAVAFGANGVAYAIFNLALPGSRTPDSWPVQARGFFNWIAVAAVVLFAVFFAQTARRRTSAWLYAMGITLAILASDILEAQHRGVGLLAFGGTAVYPATAFALALFPLLFATDPNGEVRARCACFGSALAINSVAHLGAGVIQPGPMAPGVVAVQIGALSSILALWLWNARGVHAADARLALTVVCWMLGAFLAGMIVRLAVGSYRGVQEVGFIGVGRLLATGLLVHGALVHAVFGSPNHRNLPAAPRAAGQQEVAG